MKVLFAVNDENISASIVKKYQKQYKEIISYKNVYYFNAILKELQRNKNYDRVVISEDLEEFTSSSLEQKDKFIFDRLDNISDEAVTADGVDIPIILICSERRTTSEDILVKLFGIGIYNAILGKDRTTEEVCRLINKPRSKKEAKIYYKIDSEDVKYTVESDTDVSEVEMQNILMHFKKLGPNEEKYAESFKNIVSQYNEAQLKVIIAVLPKNVKEVLQDTSKEYRKLVYGNENNINGEQAGTKSRGRKGTSEQLLNVESNQVRTKPVVVPTTLHGNVYVNIDRKTTKQPVEEVKNEDEFVEEPLIKEKPKRGRGRPPKAENVAVTENVQTQTKPARRGRPPKNPRTLEEQNEQIKLDVLPGFEDIEDDDEQDINSLNAIEENANTSRNKRNEENNSSILPGFDEDDYEEDEFVGNAGHDEEDNYTDFDPRDIGNPNRKRTSREEIYVSQGNSMQEYDNTFENSEFESLLTSEKKIVAFVGTSKNGTSFIVNNVAQILSGMGINTAILDVTQNKSAYYIYTNNEDELRNIAVNSIEGLVARRAEGVKVNNNLTVYTSTPKQNDLIKNSHPILETIVKAHSLVLLDCDFYTPVEYFDKAQEIYLVQSMDVLTIQALTEFLRDLQTKNALEESKIRIVLNKMLKLKGVTGKSIVGGMSKYNDPEMEYMKDLFDRNTVKIAAQIPFDEDVYVKYLESLIECQIKLNGYPKEMKAKLTALAENIYPLLPNNSNKNQKNKKGYNNQYSNSFSQDMNATLNNMRNKY